MTFLVNNVQHTNCFNDTQLEIINGSLLGDGSIPYRKNGTHRYALGQKEDRLEYVEFMHDSLVPFSKNIYKNKKELNNKVLYGYTVTTECNHIFSDLRKKWYKNPYKTYSQKIVPMDLKLTWLTMAVWYLEDGCNIQKNKQIMLATDCFLKKDVLFLINRLKIDLGVISNITRHGSNYRIHIGSNQYFDFINKVKEYVCFKCFDYKIDTSISQFVKTQKNYKKAVNDRRMLSQQNIAKSLNINRKTVEKWLRLSGSTKPGKNLFRDKVINLWNTNNYTKKEIAQILGCNKNTVTKWIHLEKAGIK